MPQTVLVTGGAGFIGYHAVRHYLKAGWRVVVVDNLSRAGAAHNLKTLNSLGFFIFYKKDIRDKKIWPAILKRMPQGPDLTLHLAAQVAVTSSLLDPAADYEINASGTVHLLEALRRLPAAKKPKLFIFSSTNKVYGDLAHYELASDDTRVRFANGVRAISEAENLDFHSPYGCSKGAADQYVRDYARVYGLKTVVLRQSCIYGTHQFGMEDQGWVAHFAIQALLGRPLTIYGDGKQVRDLLYADDLIVLYDTLFRNHQKVSGQVFNVGGGPENTMSLLEWIERLKGRLGRKFVVRFEPVRVGDQKIFVADTAKLRQRVGWAPKTGVQEGAEKLITWIEANLAPVRRHLKA